MATFNLINNNPELIDILRENGIEITCTWYMALKVKDEDVNRIADIVREKAPAAVGDYSIDVELTKNNVESFIGREIRWWAPAAEGNKTCEGVAVIEAVDFNRRRPIKARTIEGDDLDYAFFGNDDEQVFAYGDEDRFVSIVF